MGCDGGTIPKRNEIVKNKQKYQGRDKNADLSAKWQFCSLSGLRLKKPIVACQLGRLYNKDAIIEHLLELKTFSSAATSSSFSSSAPHSQLTHIKSLKDVKELKLKEKSDFDQTHQASSGSEQFKAQFVCPISGLDINGKYKFYYLLTCGCVLSERALKQVPDDKQCILCSKPYDSDLDLIVLNGDVEETSDLRDKLVLRRRQQRSLKKEKLEGPNNNNSYTDPCIASTNAKSGRQEENRKRTSCKDEPDIKKHKSDAAKPSTSAVR